MIAGNAKDALLNGNGPVVVVGEAGLQTGEERNGRLILFRQPLVGNITRNHDINLVAVGKGHLHSIGHRVCPVDDPTGITVVNMQIRKM